MKTKEQLRQQMKKLRTEVSACQREKYSAAASDHLTSLADSMTKRGNAILGYLALPDELTIDSLLYKWKASNIRVGIPLVSGQALIPCELPLPHELRYGRFNLREPHPDRITPLPLTQIRAIILPGLAFDLRGYRVGYGKGYYDRFLSQFPQLPTLIGICFDFQVCDTIPSAKHDIPVDHLVTPTRVYKCKD